MSLEIEDLLKSNENKENDNHENNENNRNNNKNKREIKQKIKSKSIKPSFQCGLNDINDDELILTISANAINKIKLLINKIKERYDDNYEFYFLLIADIDNLNKVIDIFVPYQFAKKYNVFVSADALSEFKTSFDNEKQKVIGWGHSHGNYDVFFSDIDNKNDENILMSTDAFYSNNVQMIYSFVINANLDMICNKIYKMRCGYILKKECLIDEEFDNNLEDINNKNEWLNDNIDKISIADDNAIIEDLTDMFSSELSAILTNFAIKNDIDSISINEFSKSLVNAVQKISENLITKLKNNDKEW